MELRMKGMRPVSALSGGGIGRSPAGAGSPVATACAACPNAARCANRRAGRAAAAVAAETMVAARAENGSPRVSPPTLGTQRLSIAHRDGLGFAAAAPDGIRVGVDLERANAVASAEARYFLTAAERASGLHPSRLWALKEAAWKMLRLDRSVPFHALELRFDARHSVRAIALRDGEELPVAAEVSTPLPGYVAAVVWSAA